MKTHLPEKYTRSYFTTARVIHLSTDKTDELDWLWLNNSQACQFATEDEAQSYANQANDNGKDSGLDVYEYPFFVVRVTQASKVERVE